MIRNNSKGFTLVELLVAVSILGLITVIALPQINNLQNENKETKYKKYAETLMTSAKLYTDSYAEDMFGYNKSGCYDIKYKELKDKDLVKNININGSSCSGGADEKTFIRVYKSNDNYIYAMAVYCTDKNGNMIYEKQLAQDTCDGTKPDEEGPTIQISPNSMDWSRGEGVTTTITVYDKYGMLENTKIKYVWTKDPSTVTDSDYKNYNFKNRRYEGTESDPLKTVVEAPQNESGEFYLVVKPVDVRDANGNYQAETKKSDVFKFDNTKPEIVSATNNKKDTWTNSDVVISSTAKDDHSGIKQIYYYYDNKTTDLKTDWNTDNKESVSGTWTVERDNEVFIIAEDNVGNKSDPVSVGRVRIDKTKPTAPTVALVKGDWTAINNNTWHTNDVYISGQAKQSDPNPISTDTSSGIKKYQISTDNSTWSDWSYDYLSPTYKISTEGTTYRYVRAVDNAGNVSDVTTKTIKVDKTNPTAPTVALVKGDWSAVSNNTWYGFDVYVSGQANKNNPKPVSTDAHSGIKKYQISTDNSTWTDWNYNSSSGTYKISSTGTFYRYVRAVDNAGRVSDVTTKTIKVDKTAPTISSITLKYTDSSGSNYTTGNWSTKPIYSKVNATDANSGGLTYSHELTRTRGETGGPWTGTENNRTIGPKTDGIYSMKYTVCDAVGNCASKTASNIKIDRTAPTVTYSRTTTSASELEGNGTRKSIFNLSDNLSGVVKICRSHCADASGNAPNFCSSGYAAKTRLSYFLENNKLKSTSDGQYDNKTVCQDYTKSQLNMQTEFSPASTKVQFAIYAYDAAGNRSALHTSTH